MDFAKQQANLSKLKDAVAASKGDRSDLLEEYNRASTMLDASKAVAYEKAGLLYKQQLAKQGLTAEQISKDSRILDLKQKELEAQQKTQESLRANVTSSLSKGEQTSMKEVNPMDREKAKEEIAAIKDKRVKEVQDELQANRSYDKYYKTLVFMRKFDSLLKRGADAAAMLNYIASAEGAGQGSIGQEGLNMLMGKSVLEKFKTKLSSLGTGSIYGEEDVRKIRESMLANTAQAKKDAEKALARARQKEVELQLPAGYFTSFENEIEDTPLNAKGRFLTSPMKREGEANLPAQKESEKSKPTTPETQNKWGSYKDGAK
jgi:hypothetical protein